MRRGTGGNRFVEQDATCADLMRSINDQLGDLRQWAEETDQILDIGKITIITQRIPSGAISVEVSADLDPIVKEEFSEGGCAPKKCTCQGHTMAGVHHVVPCCDDPHIDAKGSEE